MSRIRSVHPGLFTDEAFVGLSDAAQIFLIGLWTEADDQGVFEWKPLTLRMRLRPTKDGSVEPLLEELTARNLVREFSHDGRQYGAVRNFQRFQRPKKPNSIHFMPPEFRTYVGSSYRNGELDGDEDTSVPQKSELAPQMEDEGGRREKETKKQISETRPRKPGGSAGPYVFEAGVIRLNSADFERWRENFPHLSLRAELEGLADWAAGQKNWFAAAAGLLAKRERQAVERLAISQALPQQGVLKVAM